MKHNATSADAATSVCVYLDNVSKARVFALFVLDELQGLRLLATQLGCLFLKLISSWAFKLETNSAVKRILYMYAAELNDKNADCDY